jgi:hypothetical protein
MKRRLKELHMPKHRCAVRHNAWLFGIFLLAVGTIISGHAHAQVCAPPVQGRPFSSRWVVTTPDGSSWSNADRDTVGNVRCSGPSATEPDIATEIVDAVKR